MTMSSILKDYLTHHGIDYEVHAHPRTFDSAHTAEASHVPGDRLAKAVMLEDEQGYLMAVIPASRHVALGELHRRLARNLGLATEGELKDLFPDCELGAIPPVGKAFGVDAVVDAALFQEPVVWFEAGDHEEVVGVSGTQFKALMSEAPAGEFSQSL